MWWLFDHISSVDWLPHFSTFFFDIFLIEMNRDTLILQLSVHSGKLVFCKNKYKIECFEWWKKSLNENDTLRQHWAQCDDNNHMNNKVIWWKMRNKHQNGFDFDIYLFGSNGVEYTIGILCEILTCLRKKTNFVTLNKWKKIIQKKITSSFIVRKIQYLLLLFVHIDFR